MDHNETDVEREKEKKGKKRKREEKKGKEKRKGDDNFIFSQCQRRIEDPVLIYSLFVDKLSLVLDIGTGVMKGYIDDDKYPIELRDRIGNLSVTVQKDLEDLMKWIRHPIYSPNHPYGNKIMDRSKDNFTTLEGGEDCGSTKEELH